MNETNKQGTASLVEPSPIAQINISVRGLVEFILRHGNIDNRRQSAQGQEVMLEGANIHRMLQRRMGASYHPEYYLKHFIKRRDYEIVIDGRADGIIIPPEWEKFLEESYCEDNDYTEYDLIEKITMSEQSEDNEPAEWGVNDLPGVLPEENIVIDEIKTTYRELEYIKEPEPVHLAQAMCYAYIFATANRLPRIGVRMTYCNTESHETRFFDSVYTYAEIRLWFRELLSKYIRWTDFEIGWKRIRNASIDAMNFPYPYRDGQKELVAQVFKSIERRDRLFVMAPTGVGKTLANMYPSLKAMSLGKSDKIFYLTAKTITRTVASDCLNLLREQDMRLKSVTLTAKEKICPMDSVECNPTKCPYAKGHYDRINDAMYDFLSTEDEFSREKVIYYSNKHQVCPFEMSLDMSLFSDVIICDYNYVFDPNVYLRRFFGDGNTGHYLFLVDEAHNLVDRAMSMYSAELVKERFLDVKRMVSSVDAKLARAVESCNKHMLLLKRRCEDYLLVDDFDDFLPLLTRLSAKIEQFLDEHEYFEESKELLEFYFEVRHFMNIYEDMRPEDYVMYTHLADNGDFSARLMCANPANRIRKCTDKARATVFFSATLLPVNYYRQMFGASETDPAVYAKSVFDPARRELLIARDVTSKYTKRNDAQYDRMAEYISQIAGAKRGNYLVFFPSFAMLERVYEMYMSRYYSSNQELLVQTMSMSEHMREEFIRRFENDSDSGTADDTDATADIVDAEIDFSVSDIFANINMDVVIDDSVIEYADNSDENYDTLIGFCVLGGIFSEGIDLKNDALIGAIIIGTGLPMVCTERELLKRRYEENGLNGFDFAYRYPGMNKVEQAAGRVIRTVDDKGVVALLDERFISKEYMNLFPREWNNYKICRVDDVREQLQIFWQ